MEPARCCSAIPRVAISDIRVYIEVYLHPFYHEKPGVVATIIQDNLGLFFPAPAITWRAQSAGAGQLWLGTGASHIDIEVVDPAGAIVPDVLQTSTRQDILPFPRDGETLFPHRCALIPAGASKVAARRKFE